jgi:hypothetical protein
MSRGCQRCEVRVQPGGGHGRHGIHRDQQGPVHALRSDQYEPASRRSGAGHRAIFLRVVGVRLRRQADVGRGRIPEGRGCVPRRCPRTATAGRNSSTSVCAATSQRASDLRRVARYHNVFGPHGTYDGGREKAPAAICRKVIEAKLSGSGESLLMDSEVAEPINLGSAHLVTVNELVTIVEKIARVRLRRRYNLDAPQGVRGPK